MHIIGERFTLKDFSFCYGLAAAAKNNDSDKNDNPAAIIVAEERIKAAHCNASLHYLKIMCRESIVLHSDRTGRIIYVPEK